VATAEPAGPWGDSEARQRDILGAAAELLDEGGYGALTMRALAERARMSPGLIYQYFVDKEDVCAALLQQHQIALTSFMAAVAPDNGIRAVLQAIVPETTLQWGRIGRLAAASRHRSRGRDLAATTSAQFAALRRLLDEAARAENSGLRDSPALVPFVWAGLMGLADDLVNSWTAAIDRHTLIDYAIDALARGITEPDARTPSGRRRGRHD
jgi:AcrR family transcriptional regulator